MNDEELAGFLTHIIEHSMHCANEIDLPCHKCELSNVCGRELEYLREEY